MTETELPKPDTMCLSADGLPEGWLPARVRDMVDLVNGFAFKPSHWKGRGLPIIRIQNLNNPDAPFNYCPDSMPDKYLVETDDLLFAWSGTPGTSFGAHVWKGARGLLNQHIFRVDFNENLLDKRFLRLAINHNLDDYIAQAHGGVGLAHITKSNFETSLLSLPPLTEQKRIVRKVEECLAHVNSARNHLSRVSSILKRFRQTVLAAACSGRLTEDWRHSYEQVEISQDRLRCPAAVPLVNCDNDLPELPSSWHWATIAQIASPQERSIQSGPFGSHLLHAEFQDSGVLAIGIDNVLEGQFSLGKQHRISEAKYLTLKKFRARPNDVLITVMATVGRCCVLPENIEPAIITKHVYRIGVDQSVCEPHFLVFALMGDVQVRNQIEAQIRGQTRPGINGQILRDLAVPMPPLVEQQEIKRRVRAMFLLASTVEQKVAAATSQANKLTHSILAKAFHGELVPTEAELARREGREYEPASVLLERIKAEREEQPILRKRTRKSVATAER